MGHDAQRQQATQLLAACEGCAFAARVQTLLQMMDTLATSGRLPGSADPLLREQLQRLHESFQALASALEPALQPQEQAEAQSAEYRAFAQSLRDMAALEPLRVIFAAPIKPACAGLRVRTRRDALECDPFTPCVLAWGGFFRLG